MIIMCNNKNMQNRYEKMSLVFLLVAGLILGFCAVIVFLNVLLSDTITLHLLFRWDGIATFFASCFSIAGAGVGWAVWHSIFRTNGKNDLPRGVAVIVLVAVGIVILFLLMALVAVGGVFSG
jgi:hypothetical protein